MSISLPLKPKPAADQKHPTKANTHHLISGAQTQRLALPGGVKPGITRQPLRLPAGYTGVRIVSGSAYISYDREDHFLTSGSELRLEHGSSDAVISSMGTSTLEFEIVQ